MVNNFKSEVKIKDTGLAFIANPELLFESRNKALEYFLKEA